MTSERLIREGGLDDLPRIMEIEAASQPVPWTEALFVRELENPVSRIWVAALDGEVVGFLVVWSVVDELHILDVAVAPESRRQGHARAMLKEALADAVRRGLAYATLEVRESNTGARRLYADLGFRELGVRKRYYRDNGEDAVLLGLLLESLGAQC